MTVSCGAVHDSPPAPRKLRLRNGQAPGDVVMLTAAVRDLLATVRGKFITDVRTTAEALWERNPYVTRLPDDDPEVKSFHGGCPCPNETNPCRVAGLGKPGKMVGTRDGPCPTTRASSCKP